MQCPCQSKQLYTQCCGQLHQGMMALDAKQLMRSRYSAFVLHLIDYIVQTTVPAQQLQLDQKKLLHWSQTTHWNGLEILNFQKISQSHAQVEFNAFYLEHTQQQIHHELSTFVQIQQQWYFLDPTVTMHMTMKQMCICGSGKKFKHCCGKFLDTST